MFFFFLSVENETVIQVTAKNDKTSNLKFNKYHISNYLYAHLHN